MVDLTVITTPDFTQATFAEITTVSVAIAPTLAAHGEATLIAGLAHAIGVRRILEAASNAKAELVCEAVVPETQTPRAPDISASDGQGTVATFYFAGCDGAKKLGKRLSRAIFKGGFTCQAVAANRLCGLDETIYGGWSANLPTLDAAQPIAGWNDWSFARHAPQDTAHLVLPEGVTIANGLWRVYLPAGVDPSAFDRIVTAAMMPRQLAFWATSGEGRAHCQQHGLDPQEFVRFARDAQTGVLRPVEELYVYSPRRDAHWFAAILADALARVRAGIAGH